MPWDEEDYGGGYDMGEEQVDEGWPTDQGGGSVTPSFSYGGGGGYTPAPSYGSNYGGVSRAMADADYEEASEKDWAKRGSAGAPNRGSSSWVVQGGSGLPNQNVQTLTSRPMPATVAPPTFEALKLPEFDEATVKKERQKTAAPYLRNLRSNVQKVMQGRYENPNVKRMTLRDALGGYGQALESVMARAETEGRAIARDKWQREADEAKSNWTAKINQQNMQYQAQVSQANTNYQQLMNEWMKQNYGQRG